MQIVHKKSIGSGKVSHAECPPLLDCFVITKDDDPKPRRGPFSSYDLSVNIFVIGYAICPKFRESFLFYHLPIREKLIAPPFINP